VADPEDAGAARPGALLENRGRTGGRSGRTTDSARAEPSGQGSDRRPSDTARVGAAKARLRVALDQQLGRSTPTSVTDAAAGGG
jgi:hypothetical protein